MLPELYGYFVCVEISYARLIVCNFSDKDFDYTLNLIL